MDDDLLFTQLEGKITIEIEVTGAATQHAVIQMLETVLPYMGDNVLVRSEWVAK